MSIAIKSYSKLGQIQAELGQVQGFISAAEEFADSAKHQIRKIDPAKLGESRHKDGIWDWIMDLIYSIRAIWNKTKLNELFCNLQGCDDFIKEWKGRVEQLERVQVEQLFLQQQKQQQQKVLLEPTPEPTPESTAATTAGAIANLLTPVVAGVELATEAATVVAQVATAAYRWCRGDGSVTEEPWGRTVGHHTVTDTPAIGKEVISQFLKSMPAAQNAQIVAFLDKLGYVPDGAVVDQNGDTLTITLPEAPKLTLDQDQQLSREQVVALEAHYKAHSSAKRFDPQANVHIRDVKRFGSIGPRVWKRAKGGVQLAQIIKLRKDGNTLYLEGVAGITRVEFHETGHITVTVRIGGRRFGTNLSSKYNIEDFGLLVSFLHA